MLSLSLRWSLGLSFPCSFLGNISFPPGLPTAATPKVFASRWQQIDTKSIRNFQLGFGAAVIEAFHATHDEALMESLQREILPRGAVKFGTRRIRQAQG